MDPQLDLEDENAPGYVTWEPDDRIDALMRGRSRLWNERTGEIWDLRLSRTDRELLYGARARGYLIATSDRASLLKLWEHACVLTNTRDVRVILDGVASPRVSIRRRGSAGHVTFQVRPAQAERLASALVDGVRDDIVDVEVLIETISELSRRSGAGARKALARIESTYLGVE